MGHEVVNVNAFNTDDPSSNPARLNLCFFCEIHWQQEAKVGQYKRKNVAYKNSYLYKSPRGNV